MAARMAMGGGGHRGGADGLGREARVDGGLPEHAGGAVDLVDLLLAGLLGRRHGDGRAEEAGEGRDGLHPGKGRGGYGGYVEGCRDTRAGETRKKLVLVS